MTSSPRYEIESVLVDVSDIPLDVLLQNVDSPLLESLRRIAGDSDAETVAGFSQGLA